MARMRSLSLLIAAFLAAVALEGAAAPFAVRLGTERLVLDAPYGFSDTTDLSSPRLQELAESITAASNRILVFAIPDADLRQFMNGEHMELRRYMIAVTPKGIERERVDARQFATFVDDALRDLGKPAGEADFAKALEGQAPGRPRLLSELRRESGLVSVLQGARLPGKGGGFFEREKPQYLFSTTTLLWLRGKALNLSVYAGGPNGAPDIEWVKAVTQRWVEELQRLNAR